MNAWHKRSCFMLELSLAVSGAPCLPPDACATLGLGSSLSFMKEKQGLLKIRTDL